MSAERWNQHLAARIAVLETEIHRLRRRLSSQRRRAEMWKHRATRETRKR